MTLEEAKMTIYANCIYACEKAGFDLSTICTVDDALRTVIAIADRKTENSSEKPNNCDTCKYGQDKHRYAHICNECGVGINNYEPKDEPQTELVNDSLILVKDLVDDEFNPYDEECMRCKHLKLKCEFIPTYCKFEPKDEPQRDCLTCRYNSDEWDSPKCDGCSKAHSNYEPQTDCAWK